jgi:hypothetical protein
MLDKKHWYPPQKDPVLIGNRDAIDWYEANTWIYCFSPLKQCSQLVKPVSEYNHTFIAAKLATCGAMDGITVQCITFTSQSGCFIANFVASMHVKKWLWQDVHRMRSRLFVASAGSCC